MMDSRLVGREEALLNQQRKDYKTSIRWDVQEKIPLQVQGKQIKREKDQEKERNQNH